VRHAEVSLNRGGEPLSVLLVANRDPDEGFVARKSAYQNTSTTKTKSQIIRKEKLRKRAIKD